ncbi:hypothetical protein EDD16DRAFT_563581 [Pisolithus croceorrhizus]|nr:hypothetical protein EDD16DRAFT_563581 [Pisolithus croceorrhizus]
MQETVHRLMMSHLLKSFPVSNPADLDMRTCPGVHTIFNFTDISQVVARSEVNKHWTSILANYDVGRRDIIMGISKMAKILKPAERESLRDLRCVFRTKFPFVLTDGHLVTEGAVVAFKASSGEIVVNFANTAAMLGSVIMVLESLTPSHRGDDGVTCLDKGTPRSVAFTCHIRWTTDWALPTYSRLTYPATPPCWKFHRGLSHHGGDFGSYKYVVGLHGSVA